MSRKSSKLTAAGAWVAAAFAVTLVAVALLWRHPTVHHFVLTVLVGCAAWMGYEVFSLARPAHTDTVRAIRAGERLCPVCGYDVRASPDRCPECGNTVPPSPFPRTPALRRIDADAAREARARADNHVGTEHVLLAMLRDEDCVAAHLLAELDRPGAAGTISRCVAGFATS